MLWISFRNDYCIFLYLIMNPTRYTIQLISFVLWIISDWEKVSPRFELTMIQAMTATHWMITKMVSIAIALRSMIFLILGHGKGIAKLIACFARSKTENELFNPEWCKICVMRNIEKTSFPVDIFIFLMILSGNENWLNPLLILLQWKTEPVLDFSQF